MSGASRLLLVALGLLCTTSAFAAAPTWLRTAAATPGSREHGAVVLLDEEAVTIAENGTRRVTRRYVVRVNQGAGQDAAALRQVYLTNAGGPRSVRGWIVSARGEERELGDRDVVDVASADNDVYNEVRIRAISGIAHVGDGDVFGAEIVSDDRLLFAQLEWPLQGRWPAVLVRRTLTLPAGWRAQSVTFNAAAVAPRVEGTTTVWEATNLPGVADEPLMPPLSDLVPRVAVSLAGSDRSRPPGEFATWRDVSVWLDNLSSGLADPPEAVVEKAREVTAGATSAFERIDRVGRFVQAVQYVSIQTGLGRGGGYQPRAPASVLSKNYGDCKDKAALMRAMLAGVGIRSHLVTLYSGDARYVRREWPSPQQFNHAIIAIEVGDDVTAPSVITHPSHGRLLIFDPTDRFTPIGDLPIVEQGSLALIVSPKTDELVTLPNPALTRPLLERSVRGTLDERGTLTAHVEERMRGEAASRERSLQGALSAAEYRQVLEARIAATVTNPRVDNVVTDTTSRADEVKVTLDVASLHFAQSSGGLLLVKPPFARLVDTALPSSARQHPVVLQRLFVNDSVELTVPASYVVDELPAATTLESPFGTLRMHYEALRDRVVWRRIVELRQGLVGVTDVAALRTFLEKARSAETVAVVLTRGR